MLSNLEEEFLYNDKELLNSHLSEDSFGRASKKGASRTMGFEAGKARRIKATKYAVDNYCVEAGALKVANANQRRHRWIRKSSMQKRRGR